MKDLPNCPLCGAIQLTRTFTPEVGLRIGSSHQEGCLLKLQSDDDWIELVSLLRDGQKWQKMITAQRESVIKRKQ